MKKIIKILTILGFTFSLINCILIIGFCNILINL